MCFYMCICFWVRFYVCIIVELLGEEGGRGEQLLESKKTNGTASWKCDAALIVFEGRSFYAWASAFLLGRVGLLEAVTLFPRKYESMQLHNHPLEDLSTYYRPSFIYYMNIRVCWNWSVDGYRHINY